jgi:hypothetical protein
MILVSKERMPSPRDTACLPIEPSYQLNSEQRRESLFWQGMIGIDYHEAVRESQGVTDLIYW